MTKTHTGKGRKFNFEPTLNSLVEEHVRLNFSDFLSTLLAIFHVIKEKIHLAR